jgi:hypothetical protein
MLFAYMIPLHLLLDSSQFGLVVGSTAVEIVHSVLRGTHFWNPQQCQCNREPSFVLFDPDQ